MTMAIYDTEFQTGLDEDPHGTDVETMDREADDGHGIEINCLDLRLPCRKYSIRFKVATEARLSLAIEYLLRLLYEVESFTEAEIADFFGFTTDERNYLISHTEKEGYIERRFDHVQLTHHGRRLFEGVDGRVSLGKIELRHTWERLDLISFQPAHTVTMWPFERGLPLLKVVDEASVSSPEARVRDIFPRLFREQQIARATSDKNYREIYSIDDIQARERVWALQPVSVRLIDDDMIVPDLGLNAADQQDRTDIIAACAEYVNNTHYSDTSSDASLRHLADCAPAYFDTFFTRGSGFDIHGFISHVSMQAASLKNASTFRIVGTAWTRPNRALIKQAIDHAMNAVPGRAFPKSAIWWKPSVPDWGCANAFKEVLDTLQESYSRSASPDGSRASRKREETANFETILIAQNDGGVTKQFGPLFDTILTHEGTRSIPPSLEVLVVPDAFFLALAHVPLQRGGGYPVPVGVISHAPDLVRNAHHLLVSLAEQRLLKSGDGDREKDWLKVLRRLLSLDS